MRRHQEPRASQTSAENGCCSRPARYTLVAAMKYPKRITETRFPSGLKTTPWHAPPPRRHPVLPINAVTKKRVHAAREKHNKTPSMAYARELVLAVSYVTARSENSRKAPHTTTMIGQEPTRLASCTTNGKQNYGGVRPILRLSHQERAGLESIRICCMAGAVTR